MFLHDFAERKDWNKITTRISSESKIDFRKEEVSEMEIGNYKDGLRTIFLTIQGQFLDKDGIDSEKIYAMNNALWEIFSRLNMLKPLGGVDYKKCFDKDMIDTFIDTLKMMEGKDGSFIATHAMISWLEDYKKDNFKSNINAKNIGKDR